MTHAQIVRKLIGEIKPMGKTEVDDIRFENLKQLCALVDELVLDIDDMAFTNRNAQEFSVKRASDYGKEFLTKKLGITE